MTLFPNLLMRAGRFGLAPVLAAMMLAACSPETPEETASLPAAPMDSDSAFPASEQLGLGETIAEAVCADCHAIGLTDESAHPDAPALRDLSQKYPIEALAEPLAEGIMIGHPDMPEFQFEPEHAEALVAYIESLQPQP